MQIGYLLRKKVKLILNHEISLKICFQLLDIYNKMEIMKKKRIIIITELQAKILINNLINESKITTKVIKQKCPPMAGILSEL